MLLSEINDAKRAVSIFAGRGRCSVYFQSVQLVDRIGGRAGTGRGKAWQKCHVEASHSALMLARIYSILRDLSCLPYFH